MNLQIIKTHKEFQKWIIEHPLKPFISVDTETTSRNYLEMDLLGISFCSGTNAVYFDLLNNPEQKHLLMAFQDIINTAQLLIFHNAAFDIKVLTKFGIKIPDNIFCTMTAAHLIDENNSCGLKECAQRYLNIAPEDIYTFNEAKNSGFQSSIFYRYALNDVIWTHKLWQLFTNQIAMQGLNTVFYSIEMPFQFVLAELEMNGILVNKNRISEIVQQIEPKLAELKKQLLETANINFNSSKQLISVIKKLGLTLTVKTDKGNLACDVHVLKSLQGKHPFIDLLLEYRNLRDLCNKFLTPLPSYINSDGRIRTEFGNILVTGRLCSSNPNLQQLPKRDKFNLRSCFVAPQRKKLITVDFAGQELRVLACESQDPTMLEAFKGGQDLHLVTANKFFDLKIPEECLFTGHPDYEIYKEKFKKERDKAKTINFGISYGKTPQGFASDWNISFAEAATFVENYFKAFPKVQEAIENCKWCVKKYGFSTTFAGRKRHLKEHTNRAFRQAFNFIIQGTSADQMKSAANAVLRLFKKNPEWNAKIVLSVHDELVFEINEQCVAEAKPRIKIVMEGAFPLVDIPVEVEIKVGNDYGCCK